MELTEKEKKSLKIVSECKSTLGEVHGHESREN